MVKKKNKNKKCLPLQETQVQSLGRVDSLEKEMTTNSSILGKSRGRRSLVGPSPWDGKRGKHNLATKQQPPQRINSLSSKLYFYGSKVLFILLLFRLSHKPTISYLRVCPITYKAATYISHFLLPPQHLAVYSIPGSPNFIIALALPVD